MLDLLIRDALVVDGTGAPGIHGAVGVRDGRVVAVGDVDEPARQVIDAAGRVVAPGFVDVHTHYDAQVFWDGALTPSPLHGVTSVFAGNCGFTLAPLTGDDGDYLLRMLSRVEGMPLESLQASLPLDWSTTAEFLGRIEGTLGPNIGFMVGHSALRCAVLHQEARERAATAEEVGQMAELLAAGLAAGGMGFSSTWSRSHNDHEGNPVPSRLADRDELLALSAVLRDFPGTSLEFIPGVAPFDEDSFRTMGAMSAAADRPLNWNMLQVYEKNRDLVAHQLGGASIAAEEGGAIVALTLPDSFRTWLNFRSGFILDILPGWDQLMGLPAEAKLHTMSDPASRAEMDRLAQTATGEARPIGNWSTYRIVESPSQPDAVGRSVAELAEVAGSSAWDALADLVVADELRTVITGAERGQSRADWERRVEVWGDDRTLVGASDAGAHLDMIDSFAYCTRVIEKVVREHGLLPIEAAVHLLTQRPAELYGMVGRGTVAVGGHADLVVLDPDEVAPEAAHTRYDMPGGAGRIYGGANGIDHVVVGGVPLVAEGELTDARPGTVLRSGTDTATVLPAELLARRSGRRP
jgi:N-acyl-D-aspartate/D-glutamate deacylase